MNIFICWWTNKLVHESFRSFRITKIISKSKIVYIFNQLRHTNCTIYTYTVYDCAFPGILCTHISFRIWWVDLISSAKAEFIQFMTPISSYRLISANGVVSASHKNNINNNNNNDKNNIARWHPWNGSIKRLSSLLPLLPLSNQSQNTTRISFYFRRK